MALFEAVEEHPNAKSRRRVIVAIVLVVFVAAGLAWVLRYHKERVTILHFMTAVIAGNMQQAYQVWKPSPSYTFKDFQDDWGANGYYGPVKSFRIKDTDRPKASSAVAIKIELSPYQPFPADNDRRSRARPNKSCCGLR